MKKITSILLVLLLCLLPFNLTSCFNSEEKIQEIKDTFDSFENSDQYILITPKEIHVGKQITKIADLKYENEPCHIIYTLENGAYAYACESASDLSVNIVFIEYDTFEIKLLSTVEIPSKIAIVEHYNNQLYFRMDDPKTEEFNQVYFVYDINTAQTHTIDTDDITVDFEKSADHNRSDVFTINKHGLFRNKLKVTNKETGKSRNISNSLLKTCNEGKTIINLGRGDLGAGTVCACEKNGDIYVVFFYMTDGFLGSPCHCYIMKYDFDEHNLEYYTSIFFEKDPGTVYDVYVF